MAMRVSPCASIILVVFRTERGEAKSVIYDCLVRTCIVGFGFSSRRERDGASIDSDRVIERFYYRCDSGCYSNTTVYYRIHERSECTPVDSGVTNLIHDRRSCVDFTLKVEANVARCETQQWAMRRLPTADSIVEIGRKSRS